MTWLIPLGLIAALVLWAIRKTRRHRREELCESLLQSLLHRSRIHPRQFPPFGRAERACEQLTRRGLLCAEDIESSDHHWGAYRQRYYSLTQTGRDRARELEEDKWKDEK